jgi:uncharacterized membrane protein
MTRRKLLAALDRPRVEAAIARVEQAAAIELRVSMAGLFWGGSEPMARRAFHRLGMDRTSRRNGVLVFIAPWRRKVVIHADEGITSKVDGKIWAGVVTTITDAFHDGRFTDGLVSALEELGRALAPHFPATTRANELPDRVD